MEQYRIYRQTKKMMFPQSLRVHPHLSIYNDSLLWGIRSFFAIYLTGIMIWDFTQQYSGLQNAIYLTKVGFSFTWLYFFLTFQYKLFAKWIDKSCCYYLLILYEIMASLQFPITILYWGFVYQPGLPTNEFIMSLNLHILPFILVLIELSLNSYEFRIPHILFVIITGIFYLMINYFYSVNVEPVYNVLDWKNIKSIILVFGAFALSFLMFIFCRFVYQKFKKNKLFQKQEKLLEHQSIQQS